MAEVDGVEFEDDKFYVVELEATVQVGFTMRGGVLKHRWPELADGATREAEFLDSLEDQEFVTRVGEVTREVRPVESENPDTDA